jgi:hypothetical protein
MTALLAPSVRPSSHLATYSLAAAVVAFVCAPLVALAWFATEGGAEMAEAASVAGWSEPARALAGPLLTFAGADAVYATYTLILALVFPAVPLVAIATRSRRIATATRPERWGWRIALTGYVLFGVGVAAVGVLLIAGGSAEGLVDLLFMGAMIPGLLLSLIGSTVLGIAFLRAGHRPRLTSWLLALAFPLWIAGSFVLGHNGFGVVPMIVAWAAAARAWREAEPQVTLPVGAASARLR